MDNVRAVGTPPYAVRASTTPLSRRVRDRVKSAFLLIYKLGTRLGVHVLPVHYYVSEPNIFELAQSPDLWTRRLTLPDIYTNLDEQVENLRRICLPFQDEFRGNSHYTYAANGRLGQGRSRLFGYVEAQVLHAVIRYFKPSRVVEIGSGVATYCTFQAVSLNLRDAGVPGRITCIEPLPIPLVRNLASTAENVSLIPRPIQSVPIELFGQLQRNDIVSIDSSHVVKTGSEVNYIVLEVLPRLPKGVVVHFHDIYLPYDYQRDVLNTFVHANETSLVTAFLMGNTRFRILFALSMLHYDRREALRALLPEYRPESDWRGMRQGQYEPGRHFPSSLWLRVEDEDEHG